jgi:hypothetical protein
MSRRIRCTHGSKISDRSQDSICFAGSTEGDIRRVRERLESPLWALGAFSILPLNPNLAHRNPDKFDVSRVLFWVELQRDPDLLPLVPRQNGRFSHVLIELLDAGQLAGEIRHCNSTGAVEVILAVVTGAALQWAFNPVGQLLTTMVRCRDAVSELYLPVRL